MIHAYNYASKRLHEDRSFAEAAVTKNPLAYISITSRSRFDQDFDIFSALAGSELALRMLGQAVRDDDDFMMACIEKNPAAFQYASERIRGKKEIFESVVAHRSDLVMYGTPELLSDREILGMAVKDGFSCYVLNNGPDSAKNCPELIMNCMEMTKDHYFFIYAGPDARAMPDVAKEALKLNIHSLMYVDQRLLQDRDFIGDVLESHGEMLRAEGSNIDSPEMWRAVGVHPACDFEMIPQKFRLDSDFVKNLVEARPDLEAHPDVVRVLLDAARVEDRTISDVFDEKMSGQSKKISSDLALSFGLGISKLFGAAAGGVNSHQSFKIDTTKTKFSGWS